MSISRIRAIFKDPEIQSAESAPKDGTWILGFFEEYEPIEIRYVDGNWWTLNDGSLRSPDGWKPPRKNPSENYADKLKTLTAKQLTAEETRQGLFSSALVKKSIEEGFGNYRFSDMRAMENPPAFIVEYLKVADKQREIALEIERRLAYSGTMKPIKGR